MKLPVDNTELVMNAAVESHRMEIDSDRIDHIINMLINQYKNLPLACVREYASNGIDSHIAAGTKRPVHVTLPTEWQPKLTVEDFGLGLDKGELVNLFGKYGASSKRDSQNITREDGTEVVIAAEDQVGGFGIGCKAAFTVCEAFTVCGIKNNMKTVVMFSRTKAGGSINIISEEKTDEPNGVKVQIPIKNDCEAYAREAKNLFRFFAPGSVEVFTQSKTKTGDHTPFEIIFFDASALSITPTLHVIEETHSNQYGYGQKAESFPLTIRMGGIAYALTTAEVGQVLNVGALPETSLYKRLIKGDRSIVIDAPIGSLSLTPSRESLMLDDKTKPALKKIFDEAEATIRAHYNKQLSAQKDRVAAVRYYMENEKVYNAFVGADKAEYKGQTLPMKPGNNVTAVMAKISHGGKLDVSTHTRWTTWDVPVVIIDHDDEDIVTDTDWSADDNMKDTDTTEHVSLRSTRFGVVRKNLSPFLNHVNGLANGLTGFKREVRKGEDIIFVFAHEVKDDAYVQARYAAKLTLEQVKEKAKQYRSDARKATMAANAATGTPGTAAVKAGPTGIAYNVYHPKGQGSLYAEDIAAYDNIYYVSESEFSDYGRGIRSSGDAPFVNHLPKNSIVIKLRPTQRTDAFQKRLDKHTETKALSYSAWRTPAIKNIIEKKLTQLELTQIEMCEGDFANAYKNMIEPLLLAHRKGQKLSINTASWLAWAEKMEKAHNDDSFDRAACAGIVREMPYGKNVPTAKGGLVAFMNAYPIMRMAYRACGGYSSLALNADQEMVKGFCDAIEALDRLAGAKVITCKAVKVKAVAKKKVAKKVARKAA